MKEHRNIGKTGSFIRVKAKLALCLIKHHAMKTSGGLGVYLQLLDLGSR
jgi:hypothetical protein